MTESLKSYILLLRVFTQKTGERLNKTSTTSDSTESQTEPNLQGTTLAQINIRTFNLLWENSRDGIYPAQALKWFLLGSQFGV